MQRRLAAGLLTVGVLAAGCQGDDPVGIPTSEASPSPIVSDEPSVAVSAGASAEAIDISVVPPVEQMTVEYVEAVVNAIEAESGKLFAAVLAEPVNPLGATPAGTIEGLEALFGADRLQLKIEEAEALAASEEARSLALPASAYVGVSYGILQVSYAETGCLIAIGRIDRAGTTPNGRVDPVLSILSLGVHPSPDGRNPTPWRLLDSTPNETADGTPNDDQFALDLTLEDLGGVVPHDCSGGEASRVD